MEKYINKIIERDCLKVLKEIPDNSVDMAFADPPFNLKKQYKYRCVTCCSEEGKPNIHWPNTVTKLQKCHKDPSKPLVPGNIIPQCQKCNRGDRNNWVYDERGRVIKLANPIVIKRSDKEIRWKVYKILYEEFKGKNPNE